MICERCKARQATLHVVSMQNNEKVESYLCEECASEIESLYNTQKSFDEFFKSLLNMPSIATTASSKSQGLQSSPAKIDDKSKVCPMCQMTLKEFKKTGKLGCGKCYTVFSHNIHPIIKRIQGNTHHSGKIPKRAGEKLRTENEIIELRHELQLAIKEEAFEEAARLRDTIRALEKSDKGGQETHE